MSPFRVFFNRLKVSPVQRKLWKRSCDAASLQEDDQHNLSMEEYEHILRDHMNFQPTQIEDHIIIIEKVRACGVVGLKLNAFEAIFSPILSKETMSQWSYHVQVCIVL